MLLEMYVKGKTLLWGLRERFTREDGAVATEYGLLLDDLAPSEAARRQAELAQGLGHLAEIRVHKVQPHILGLAEARLGMLLHGGVPVHPHEDAVRRDSRDELERVAG